MHRPEIGVLEPDHGIVEGLGVEVEDLCAIDVLETQFLDDGGFGGSLRGRGHGEADGEDEVKEAEPVGVCGEGVRVRSVEGAVEVFPVEDVDEAVGVGEEGVDEVEGGGFVGDQEGVAGGAWEGELGFEDFVAGGVGGEGGGAGDSLDHHADELEEGEGGRVSNVDFVGG